MHGPSTPGVAAETGKEGNHGCKRAAAALSGDTPHILSCKRPLKSKSLVYPWFNNTEYF